MDDTHSLDVPLLKAFVAIYETGSVTAAAERLTLTQPTISYTLARLREILNDRLFIREGRTMVPTRRAQDCYEKFRAILHQINELVDQQRAFNPTLSSRRFRLAMSDIGALAFLPPLLKYIQHNAPGIEIETMQAPPETLPEALALGKIDAAVGNLPLIGKLTESALLLKEEYWCLLSSSHPTIKTQLSLETYLTARHAHVSSELTGHKHLESILRNAGIVRKIALQVQQFTVLPHLITSTDLLVIVPGTIGRMFEGYGGLKLLPLPFEVPPLEVRVHWDRQQGQNAPQTWLIETIRKTMSNL
ncbi:LysR family transcriptional regulator [Neopusillimonas maritima]|jgi:DNA-binding transcriptional LysR family regulator|uniref:HTH lysR-type domain-containing protein n=1 Tax=Neopusillimonas maritima TaxID=2026239 RepID=A0ABX9MTC4_9BURK|nr:LysR family transcriptional regulator [Neopusillimonas maritima]MAL01154.1 LysR family transcriptional regulator [Alcaligenaceae bacterium]RII81816.1 hypothetical protein CJO09_14620 [Neopusillimonas maritima]